MGGNLRVLVDARRDAALGKTARPDAGLLAPGRPDPYAAGGRPGPAAALPLLVTLLLVFLSPLLFDLGLWAQKLLAGH